MKPLQLIISLVVLTLVGCSSTNMSLKRIDQDIPEALVKKYNSDKNPYVDEGEYICLPLLLFADSHVAQTSSGFQAYSSGDLGLIILGGTKKSYFDDEGKLLKYHSSKTFLTSLINHESYTKLKTENGFETSYRNKFLLGAFGTNKKMSGEKELLILWIPIRTS
ncbi:hypothetical protein P4C99_02775 [Pontiellaceae bacterium B1224]|nr:hypothetical protein [Pontiellaceae bacterium B1224]